MNIPDTIISDLSTLKLTNVLNRQLQRMTLKDF